MKGREHSEQAKGNLYGYQRTVPTEEDSIMAKVLWIGVGNMGLPISINLMRAGHEVTVCDVDAAKTAEAEREGAAKASTPAQGAVGADFIFVMVPDSKVLEQVVMGNEGIAGALAPGQTVIDMSTVSAESSRNCNAAVAAKGAQFLRAPVNGSTVFAREAKLTVICSGPKDAYEKALPLFESMSRFRFYVGEEEQARYMKLAINLMVATTSQMFSEAAVITEKAGIDWNTALDVFSGSAIASPQLGFKIPPLRNRDFSPAFTTRLMAKDMELALAAAKELGVYTPVTAATKQMLEATIARGSADRDFSALLETVEAMSGLSGTPSNAPK